jgi:hypothetical protein
MEREFTRQQLYDLVWQEPLRTLAKPLGISDVRFAKICRHANIPLPGLGYWAKHAHGKAPPRPPLPARALGQHDAVKIGGHRWHQPWLSDDDVLRTEVPPPPSFPETLDEATARARKLVGRVPQISLKKPHPLIAKLLAEDDERRRKALESSWHWDKPIFDNPMAQRRLRLINRLFWALVRLGCKPAVLGKDASAFSVTVGDEIVRFTIDPPGTDRTDPRARPTRAASDSKILQVELSWYQPPAEIRVSWMDSATQPLEEQLTDVAVGLIVAGEWLYREGLIRHRNWLVDRKRELAEKARREAAERQRKEREKILKREQARREKLLSDAENWNKATLVRQYVHAVLEEPRSSDAATAANRWAQWALAEADRMDPLRQSVDHLLAMLSETGDGH